MPYLTHTKIAHLAQKDNTPQKNSAPAGKTSATRPRHEAGVADKCSTLHPTASRQLDTPILIIGVR